MSDAMNDYCVGNDFVCGRCKAVVNRDEGTCDCEAFVGGDLRVVVLPEGQRSPILDHFTQGLRLGRKIEGLDS